MSAESDFLQLAQQFSFNRMPELASDALQHARTLQNDRVQHDAWMKNMNEIQNAVQRAIKAHPPQPRRSAPDPRSNEERARFEAGPPNESVSADAFNEHVVGLVESGRLGQVHHFSIRDPQGTLTPCMVTIAESFFDEVEDRICRTILVALNRGGSWRVEPVIYWRHKGRWIPAPKPRQGAPSG